MMRSGLPSPLDGAFDLRSKRYSGEVKKPGMRKRGLSSLANSLQSVFGGGSSSPRMKISLPENPVHVHHVGYDNRTGKFTVREKNLFLTHFDCDHYIFLQAKLCVPEHI